MYRKAFNFILAALIFLFVLSCATYKGAENDGLSYEDVLKLYTKSGKAYDEFETKLIVSATYKDMGLVEAQVNKKGEELLYDKDHIDTLVKEEQRDNVFYVNFFVAAYTPDEKFADFSKGKELWKFYIKKGDHELVDVYKIKKVVRVNQPEYEVLYPYLSNWMQGYEISFARSDLYNSTNSKKLSRPFSLIIAGQLGRVELVFD
jgi:cell division protein FtsI/penicillin-binding protein 2